MPNPAVSAVFDRESLAAKLAELYVSIASHNISSNVQEKELSFSRGSCVPAGNG